MVFTAGSKTPRVIRLMSTSRSSLGSDEVVVNVPNTLYLMGFVDETTAIGSRTRFS